MKDLGHDDPPVPGGYYGKNHAYGECDLCGVKRILGMVHIEEEGNSGTGFACFECRSEEPIVIGRNFIPLDNGWYKFVDVKPEDPSPDTERSGDSE